MSESQFVTGLIEFDADLEAARAAKLALMQKHLDETRAQMPAHDFLVGSEDVQCGLAEMAEHITEITPAYVLFEYPKKGEQS